MRKLRIEDVAVVMLPVKVRLGLLVGADDDARVDRIIERFAKGKLRTVKADVEDVGIEAAEIEDGLDADEPLAAHVGKLLEDGGRITVTANRVTDSR